MLNLFFHFAGAAVPKAVLTAGDKCDLAKSGFLNFPTWYSYLNGQLVPTTGNIKGPFSCTPTFSGLSDVWLVVAAIIEILLQVAALVSVAFVIYGGIRYTTSQGEPEKTNKARNTILQALVGLAIAVMAATGVTFIAGSIH